MIRLVAVALGLLAACRCGGGREAPRAHVTVTVVVPGASPSELEAGVVMPVEEAVAGIEGVLSIRAEAREGGATVVIAARRDLVREVQERVRAIARELPADADPPVVLRGDPAAPFAVVYAIAGPLPLAELSELVAERVRFQVARVPGVTDVVPRGTVERVVNVRIDPARLAAVGLTLAELASALDGAGRDLPAGTAAGGRVIRIRGRPGSVAELAELVLVAQREAVPVRLRDVANVELGLTPAASPGPPGVGIRIREDAPRGKTLRAIEAALAEVRGALPAGVTLTRQPDPPAPPPRIVLGGIDRAVLADHAQRLARELGVTPPRVATTHAVELDRAAAARLGISTLDITRTLQLAGGRPAGELDRRSIVLRVDTKLEELQVRGAEGALVPLGRLARLAIAEEPAVLLRIDRMRAVELTLAGADLDRARERVEALQRELPAGYRVELVD